MVEFQTVCQDDGSPLNSSFAVEETPAGLTVVIESRGGTRGEPDARNLDYGRGFELILRRLQEQGAAIVDATVDSRATQHLSADERRLAIEGKPYPITIEDAEDLQRRMGAAQARVGREPGARGSGNRTKRVRLVLGFPGVLPSPSRLGAELARSPVAPQAEPAAPLTGGAQPLNTRPIGRPYVEVETLPRTERREPFDVDPDKVDRGNQAHADTQNGLADFLRSTGLEPRSPALGEPEFDLAWENHNTVFVAEVKSVTAENEEKQLRLGLGQVLRYRQALFAGGRLVVAVLIPERKPADETWMTLCRELGVVLVWPAAFDALLESRGG